MREDFNGFIALREKGKWQDIKKYVFVIKRKRSGITSNVINVIADFQKTFPVDIMAMDDLKLIANSCLLFSEDGMLLQELKNDVTDIMEYIIETDFSAQPFRMSLSDEIEIGILEKWSKKRYLFLDTENEKLKQNILQVLGELCYYLTPTYMHALPDGRLLFNNDSWEAGERLRNELQPQIYKMRCTVKDLLDKLYSIK